ncbi:hypothetical protein [Methylomonas rapida]|jgi:hypothetical protein|uniref:Uncharacterized protein n=1 Tax=Methylomonas rapida TaxID=2963939 RepID=A0ABY7GIP2_9GAMM|nr:hypothetical protein [Methylomonas rapida]WAR44401.1 hypothetical protein NM686_018910 [Methylomonas rapida]
MKIVTVLIVVGLGYGFVRLITGVIKELAEIAAEAWHSGETGR